MKHIKKVVVLGLCFFMPIKLMFWILNLMGHRVHRKAKVGFSLLWIDGILDLREGARIGSFNVIKIQAVEIGPSGYIGNYNKLVGPFELILAAQAAIGNGVKCYRAPHGVTYGKSILQLGILSKITANHRVDCTRSIKIGNYSILAGHDSQVWTHAYYHDKTGPGRFRLDGDIEIGDNVYIGSMCVINCGVTITDRVIVGAGSCISKSLLQPGTYVSQAMRFIEEISYESQRAKYKKIEGVELCEDVFEKK